MFLLKFLSEEIVITISNTECEGLVNYSRRQQKGLLKDILMKIILLSQFENYMFLIAFIEIVTISGCHCILGFFNENYFGYLFRSSCIVYS